MPFTFYCLEANLNKRFGANLPSIATFKYLKFSFLTVNCCFGLFGASLTTVPHNRSRAEAPMAWSWIGLVADHRCRAEDRLRGSSAENYEWELLLPARARVLLRGVTARWLIVDKCIYIITYLQIHRPIANRLVSPSPDIR